MTQHFDPVTLEILWRRLVSIVDEADAAVARTAFSSVLRDSHDYTCMFTDRHGERTFMSNTAISSNGLLHECAKGLAR